MAVTPTAQSAAASFDLLERHLSAQNLRQADAEARRLLIALARDDAAQERGYVRKSSSSPRQICAGSTPVEQLQLRPSVLRSAADGELRI
ncbi:unnamed protein product [Cuscuta campestris]|uniref:Uncharacterized protein n=1 Tax=Cuscuta campestris TaxID=132261 RepID=A0A484N0M7_9ASTE|nr:unnamed protein product [Cuscuta campestris]